jgi:hypothetical protein
VVVELERALAVADVIYLTPNEMARARDRGDLEDRDGMTYLGSTRVIERQYIGTYNNVPIYKVESLNEA